MSGNSIDNTQCCVIIVQADLSTGSEPEANESRVKGQGDGKVYFQDSTRSPTACYNTAYYTIIAPQGRAVSAGMLLRGVTAATACATTLVRRREWSESVVRYLNRQKLVSSSMNRRPRSTPVTAR